MESLGEFATEKTMHEYLSNQFIYSPIEKTRSFDHRSTACLSPSPNTKFTPDIESSVSRCKDHVDI